MKRMLPLSIACLAFFAFAACGGGGAAPAPYDGPTTIPYDGPGGGLDGGAGSGSDSGGGGSGGGGVTWRVLTTGDTSTPTVQTTLVARDEAGYAQAWIMHIGPILTFAGPPDVDFASEMVLGVYLGGRPSTGYSVRITDIVPENDGLRVTVEETQPGPGRVVATVITQPSVLVAVSKVPGTVTFDFTTVIQN